MIRLVGIALVIWGLIVQPLMAAMPMKMADSRMDAMGALDVEKTVNVEVHGSHHTQAVDKADKAPCDEGTVQDGVADNGSAADACNNSVTDCVAGGACCGFCGASVSNTVFMGLEPQINAPSDKISEYLVFGLISRIYRPPITS